MKNNKKIILLLSFCLFGTVGVCSANEGKDIYKKCVACHGVNGEGNTALNTPKIAGQQSWYLEKQLNAFKAGHRGGNSKDVLGQQMKPISQALSSNEVVTVSKYMSEMPISTQTVDTSAKHMNGYRYYQAKCGACHGGVAEGNQAFSAPRLAGLDVEYLQRQMSHFKTGIRGYAQEDKASRQMSLMSKIVNDKELGDILNYVSKL